MKKITIIGFGNQAKAWAKNLRDSGYDVSIGLRDGSSTVKTVDEEQFKTVNLDLAPSLDSLLVLLIPDSEHLRFFKKYSQKINPSAQIIYAHGYSCVKDEIPRLYPNFSHLLLAPKGIAAEVRNQYVNGGKLGAAYGLEYAKKESTDYQLIKDLSKDIGITAGPYETTFKMETFADLFSEQSLLCSLIPYGAAISYNSLREKGVSKEIAYLECWYELKLIVDTMVKAGPDKFFDMISPNALAGGEKARKIIFDKAYEKKIKRVRDEVYDQTFFKEVDNINFDTLKKEVNSFWEKEELSKTHQELKHELFE